MKALRGLEKFSSGWWWWVHKVIIVSVRGLYIGFLISLVFGFFGFHVFVFHVFWTGRDTRFFRMGRDAELDNFLMIPKWLLYSILVT